MKIKKYSLIYICGISILILANLSIQLSFQNNFDISLKNINAFADPTEGGTWPELKEFSCFVGTKGDPKNTFLKEDRYCGDCKSARIAVETGTGHCKSFE